MDVKYGLTDAFTLDVTLVPDFGQVQFDQFVLNLSPFEVRFNENRQFFLEGTELFSKGDLFYSRRVGGLPIGYFDVYGQLDEGETVESNPGESQLINASKISGRTGSGLGIGFFNAVSAPTHAVISDSLGNDRQVLTSPLTNYNILVLDQNLNKNSFVTLINTNVMRAGDDYDANVTGLRLQLRDKKNRYGISGGGAYNRLFAETRTPEDDGYTYDFRAGKVSGNFLFGVGSQMYSPDYDPTDLGFLFNNNEVSYNAYCNYNRYKPFGPFNRAWVNLNTSFNRGIEPNAFYGAYANINGGIFDKYFNAYGLNFNSTPLGSFDYFDPRIPGYFVKQPSRNNIGGWFSSDYRKKVALDLGYDFTSFDAPGREAHAWNISPRWRISDRLMLIYSYDLYLQHKQLGFAFLLDEETSIFGHRDLNTHTQSLTASYIFTNTMGLTCRARHYWSKAEYLRFEQLQTDGTTLLIDQTPHFNEDDSSLRDVSFNSFTVDLVYRWVFLPGSEMNVVWKNSIIGFSQEVPANATENLEYTFAQPSTNSLSIKVLYFLDYLVMRKALTPKSGRN